MAPSRAGSAADSNLTSGAAWVSVLISRRTLHRGALIFGCDPHAAGHSQGDRRLPCGLGGTPDQRGRSGASTLARLAAKAPKTPAICSTALASRPDSVSIVGTCKDLADVYAIHAQGRTRVVRETRKLDEVNECYRRG
jgi:hypothetical protein